MLTVLNAKGQAIVLNQRETLLANAIQRQTNALGFEIPITTLTSISKRVTEQKFFHIAPADYLPVRVGEGAWSTNMLTYLSFNLAGDFEEGNINTGGNSDRLARADAGVSSLTIDVKNWAKGIGWTLIELQQAAKAGNWDLVTAKEQSRKMNWDLGIQKIAFLGASNDATVLGLYTQSGVTVDLSTIPQAISTLSTVDLKALVTNIVNVYRANNNRTAWPTHFIMPESDFLGCVSQASADFPIKTVLEMLQEAFAVATNNKNFKILPNAYGDHQYSGQTYQQYALLNYDETSLRMDIPVDYTNTLANSTDNFMFQNVGYGQYTGVLAYRPLELYYFRFTP